MTRHGTAGVASRVAPATALCAALAAIVGLLGCLFQTPAAAAQTATTGKATSRVGKPCCQSPSSVVHTGGKQVRRPNPASYPFANQANSMAGDPWGSTERQCVGYATWWLNAAGVSFGLLTRGPSGRVAQFGNAKDWAAAAKAAGWSVRAVPRVGAVAQWNGGEQSHWTVGNVSWTSWAGSAGHVAIVTAVYPDRTVQVSEYNANGDRKYHSERTKAPRYLYIGV